MLGIASVMCNGIFIMLLQALHTYKLQIPLTFTSKPVLYSTQYRLTKSTCFKCYSLNFRKAAFWPEMEKSICKVMSVFFSYKLIACLRALKIKFPSGKIWSFSLCPLHQLLPDAEKFWSEDKILEDSNCLSSNMCWQTVMSLLLW